MQLQQLTVLGSTGSIGVSTLDVVRRHPERYRVRALCAHRQVMRLAEQCREFRPDFAVVGSAESASLLAQELTGMPIEILHGPEALCRMASLPEVDAVMAAIVGAAGLAPTLAAVHSGKKVLLANKEALVMAGPVFMAAVARHGATLLPIDSEHNAIFQSLPINFSSDLSKNGVRRILLTASGGPFRNATAESLESVTPDQACAHPNWVMGRKISVDSASMMNKGLEVIEAHYLFNVAADRIQVVIHPQSVIHSLVEYVDGSVLAELGNPDMRTPIAHALAFPERIESGVGPLDLFQVARLDFQAPDLQRFPCLSLAYRALAEEGSAPALLNAANEVAVEAFLAGQVGFTAIPRIIEATLNAIPATPVASLEAVMEADRQAREKARALLAREVAR
ncbi:1-deoxy-D-xylulose 5-phosphate reductoisomerase [Azospira sp. I13]|uniref:1-deoxy-D-xylulose-5-phosphate reductoisomerase n=1 Tax=Azospira sp. I13 TaxID=1765050 RepID=UPI000D481EDA|nr:1-deoxy-D-xylulose-5-phosphate reductoisomerase [Azospira sp. I13]GBG01794.1 1-deoxy-D-xylulose 5-phosphate reductoisomerase [Azospira sp. I13]